MLNGQQWWFLIWATWAVFQSSIVVGLHQTLAKENAMPAHRFSFYKVCLLLAIQSAEGLRGIKISTGKLFLVYSK